MSNSYLLLGIAVLFTIAVLIFFGAAFLICWTAKGESDVNGEKERDAQPNFHLETKT